MAEELEVTASLSNISATATLASDDGDTTRPIVRQSATPTWRGTTIGRYIALSQLGAGAMGVVLAAYDPQLDRKVALKLLGPRSSDPVGARARLQREAQALARLDNPNVVGVHDVGVHGDQLFVAMDFVAGKTLGAWMGEVMHPRPYREVLSVFMDAGRGLAAAHRAGLIHRDFKPDNVMLGDDGRVRVMDFGLARAEFELESHAEGPDQGQSQLTHLTRAGTVMGTPAYMPLEQFEAREADARSDQFSFCVSLYQALYGERPFAGRSLMELQVAIAAEQIRPAPRDVDVPTWVRKAVVRGLAKDPSQRWPNMQALLDALTDDPSMRRRKWWAAAGLLALLGGGTWGVISAAQREAEVCQTAQAKLDGTWDRDRRKALRQAMLSTKLSYAPDTWIRVERHLDEYAGAWVTARTEACEATQSGEQSSELMDLRMACLDDRLLSLRKTVDELSQADATTVSKSISAVLGLPSLDGCADVEALLAEMPPPDDPDVATRVRQLDEQLLETKAKQNAGRHAEALAIANAVVTEAEQLGYEPLVARAWLRQGDIHNARGEADLAETSYKKSFTAAVAQQMPMEALTASVNLVNLVGRQLARPEEGRRWAEYAEPLSRAVGTEAARADYLDCMGINLSAEGKADDARGYFEQALAIRDRDLEHNGIAVAATLWGLGRLEGERGNLDPARAHFERAFKILQDMLGPQHPAVASALSNLAAVQCMQGDLTAGRASTELSLSIQTQAHGPDHPDLGVTLHNLGNIAATQHEFEDARDFYERSLAIQEKHLGREHPNVASVLLELGNVAAGLKAYDEANRYYERALATYEASNPEAPELGGVHSAIAQLAQRQRDFTRARTNYQHALTLVERAFGPEHPDVAVIVSGLGQIAYAEADYEGAHTFHARALAIYEKALGPEHPDVAGQLCRQAETLLALGEVTRAIADSERALKFAGEVAPILAMCRFALARALWEAPIEGGRDRVRARDLALLARDFYASHGESDVADWLRNHGGLAN